MPSSSIPQLVRDDPWLEPQTEAVQHRLDRYRDTLASIGDLAAHATAHQTLGIHLDPTTNTWTYTEWAPRAKSLSLIGEFNGWNRTSHPLEKHADGTWAITLPDSTFNHGDHIKVHVVGENGAHDRIPPYTTRTVQNPETKDFTAQVWLPGEPFPWSDQSFTPESVTQPLIYECHIGMAQEKEAVGTYREFANTILPRIAKLGYNTVQIMAVAEHPYYGSFGYHVSNFFAPSSRFGTPEDLKHLINDAHNLGIAVLLDVVHSHAVKNFAEGLAEFDGSDGLYFHTGDRAQHPGWDSFLFDYGRPEVRRFLLSNLAYWIDEFHFDGFRFDGVTSMLYHHHGEIAFDSYDRYFDDAVDNDAVTYLQLANTLTHQLKPGAITIAEDMSGMPGACRPVGEGGLGFDYRLAMGVPDHWIKLLKHSRDEDWNLEELWGTLTDRRSGEKTIAYAESHDQALVGDKTLAFWLMDQEMYWHMKAGDEHPVVDRGIALHKMIRLLTLALGGEGYLNFIGNEFGHPEWVDFPREGNGWSCKYARRQWSLADHPDLKYRYLKRFDAAMLDLAKTHNLLTSPPARQLNIDQHNLSLMFERANLVFAFNFHPGHSVPDYALPLPDDLAGHSYTAALSTDAPNFGGHNRIDPTTTYPTTDNRLTLYLPSRTATVFARRPVEI